MPKTTGSALVCFSDRGQSLLFLALMLLWVKASSPTLVTQGQYSHLPQVVMVRQEGIFLSLTHAPM